ncbi:MerR family transcriptional regulator [Sedimentibacter saalensis]|jgi:DNA-binding transcriptional MerR regulator|uniref:DNA-binding transcriptional MerR regulator n=1 Tax=Sedimentibacter saalensis TaxID=130788 RepID=A0A562J7W1_9FIRM|nr:MerR family transcriptional regulator [Sedimentibacter saalensis]MEA5093760.1 MerR family transcriptional regulator [Sedimentibacter saalensis]TWH79025.1 DNA-binding transcriptional MerR regulator [Sedimentibacter saalensis]
MNTYKTSEVAHIIGIHPNTVRLYEKLELIPKPERMANGYRVFTDFHVEQIKFVRTALKVEVLQNGLRKQAIDIIKISASGNFSKAIHMTESYLLQIRNEQRNAEEAIEIAEKLLSGSNEAIETAFLTRKETADYLHISMDALRNWEMNGLLTIKRRQNGYRVYRDEDIRRLKIIRSLRCANYSLSAILRMLNTLSKNPSADIRQAIDTPKENEDIISVCDKLITSLRLAEQNAEAMLTHLEKMKKQIILNPTL